MKRINLKYAFELFMQSRETFCRDVTIENYNNTLNYFIDYICADRELTAQEIYVDELVTDDLNGYSIYLKHKIKNDGHPFYPVAS